MDKYVINRIKITYGIFTSLLLVGLLCLALCSFLLVYSFDNIAYADNGVVNNNLFTNPDFSISYNNDNLFSMGTVQTVKNVTTTNSGTSVSYSNNKLTLINNSAYNGALFLINFNSVGTYTFTISFNALVSGDYMFRLRDSSWGTYFQQNYSYSVSNNNVRSISYNITDISKNYAFQFYRNVSGAYTSEINWVKIEKGSSFTGYVPKDYENYGYNQGVSVGSNSTAYINSGYILDKTVLLSDLENGSTFAINNINYRFQGSTVLDNYFQTNVINSWPLGANGDTNHRYLGFLITDELYKFSAIQISIVRDGAGYLYFSGDGLTPKVVDLSSLSPVSSYPFNYLNQSTYMDTFVIYSSEFTNVYYLSYLDTSSSSAGDTVFFNTINIYSNLDNSSWYDRGIETGKTLGYSEGYNKGYQEGSDYSGIPFYNMFGAIFDVPVQTINGLLDFNILGVNMKGFILGLISLCIILFILKIVFK